MYTTMVIFLLSLAVPTIGLLGGNIGRAQSIAVSGQLMCNGKPATNVKVKLYDNNHFTTDNFLAQVKTDGNGYFRMTGKENLITSMDPKINVYHNCNDHLPCDLKLTINIPSSYVTSGSTPSKTFDAGVLNLSGNFKGQTRDCFNKK